MEEATSARNLHIKKTFFVKIMNTNSLKIKVILVVKKKKAKHLCSTVVPTKILNNSLIKNFLYLGVRVTETWVSCLSEAAAVSISVLQLQLEEPTAGASVNIQHPALCSAAAARGDAASRQRGQLTVSITRPLRPSRPEPASDAMELHSRPPLINIS